MLASIAGLNDAELDAERAGLAPEMPPAFAEMLAAALAQERRDGAGRDATLRRHYLDLMPALRTAQLDPSLRPQAALFHAPLDPARLPRLVAALDRLYDLVARAGVPAERAL